jgi:hypothetical protein
MTAMNRCSLSRGGRGGPRLAAVVLAAAASVGLAPAADPAAASDGPEPRAAVGKCASPDGTLLARRAEGKDWRLTAHDGPVFSRDVLLALPGMRAAVDTEPGAVNLALVGSTPQLSPSPVLQSAVVLHDSRAYDLDVSLREGRVILTNTREKGPAKVWLRLPGFAWQLTLTEPGTRVGMEVYGRWPIGASFTREPKPWDEPTKVVLLLMFKGKAYLETDTHAYDLAAPPGPAFMQWDSVAGEAEGPQTIKALPSWADPNVAVPAEGKAVEDAVEAYQAQLKKAGSPEAALEGLLDAAAKEKDKPRAAMLREIAVLGLGALDDTARVAELLADPHSADTRDAAVVALRMRIGAYAGRDLELYHLLQDQLGYTDRQAETVLDLLHTPFDRDKPATYEALIHLLQHPKLAVRALARWHLYRLTPVGKDIAFDPAGPEDERAKAVKAWSELVPPGQLPKETSSTPPGERRGP